MQPKVAHIVTTFFPTNVSAWVSALAEDQRERGWQVEFIVGRNASDNLIREKERQGFQVTQLNSLRKYIYPLQDVQALGELTSLLRRKKFDLVHTHLAKAGILGRLAARLAGVRPIIHSVYGATFAPQQSKAKFLLFKGLEKLVGRVTDQFIFVGRELQEAYRRFGVCPNGRGAVVYYGKDLIPFLRVAALTAPERRARKAAAGFSPESVILGNVSRLVPWKGHHHALDLMAGLKRDFPCLKLVIVGDAKTPTEQAYKQRLTRQVKDLGLEEDLVFTGWQSDPASYYALFDLYLLTSMPFEGVPGSVIEAAIAGVPVVGFDCYGVREIPGVRARLVPHQDLNALAQALREEIARLPAAPACRRLSQDQLRRMQEQFSMARMVTETFNLYRQALARRKGLPGLHAAGPQGSFTRR